MFSKLLAFVAIFMVVFAYGRVAGPDSISCTYYAMNYQYQTCNDPPYMKQTYSTQYPCVLFRANQKYYIRLANVTDDFTTFEFYQGTGCGGDPVDFVNVTKYGACLEGYEFYDLAVCQPGQTPPLEYPNPF